MNMKALFIFCVVAIMVLVVQSELINDRKIPAMRQNRLTCSGKYGGVWFCQPSCMTQNCASGKCEGETCVCSRCANGANNPWWRKK